MASTNGVRRITIDIVARTAGCDSMDLVVEATVRHGPGDLSTASMLPREWTESDVADAMRDALGRLVTVMHGAGWILP